MTESTASTTVSSRGRKIRAIPAGGVVLGVGAAVTLAAWTDQEWATGLVHGQVTPDRASVPGQTPTSG